MASKSPFHGKVPLLTGIWLVPSCGGIPNTMRKFRDALGAKVVSFTDRGAFEREGTAFEGIEHVLTGPGLAGRLYNYAPASARQWAEALASQADLLTCHVMLRYHANWVMAMAKRHNIPYWFIPHGQLDPYVYSYRSAIKRIWALLYGKRLLCGAAHIIFSTERERDKAKWLYSGANTRVVHWPVELADLDGKAAARQQLRSRLGIADDAKVFLSLGRLHPMKRPLECIHAMAAIGAPNTHLVIVGPEDGVTIADCKQRAANLGIGSRVHVPGPIYGREKQTYLLGADCYLSLSIRENFGHTAGESLAAEVPVILSPGNDLAPELERYRCGWFLKDDRPESATAAISEAISTSVETLQEMGQRGRTFIANECSFEGFKQQLLELRSEALGTHHK